MVHTLGGFVHVFCNITYIERLDVKNYDCPGNMHSCDSTLSRIFCMVSFIVVFLSLVFKSNDKKGEQLLSALCERIGIQLCDVYI